MYWTKEQTDRILRDIMARSQRDEAFRRLCLEDSGAAVKEISGHEVTPGFTVRFVDNAGADLTLVLPDPIGSEGQLSDEELSSVRGGVIGGANIGTPAGVHIQNIRLMKG